MSATTLSNNDVTSLTGSSAEAVNRANPLGWVFFVVGLVFSLIALLGMPPATKESLTRSIGASLSFVAETANGGEPTAATVASVTVDDSIGQLSPEMQKVLDHVTRRYRVASTTLAPIFAAAQEAGAEHGIDPLLIVAVIGIESGFNPFAESPLGAQGLMQVIPRFHKDKVPADAGEHPFLDPVTNVRIGADVLREAIRMRGSLIAGLQQYGGSSDPAAGYASKVLAEKQRLDRIAGRPGAPAV